MNSPGGEQDSKISVITLCCRLPKYCELKLIGFKSCIYADTKVNMLTCIEVNGI